METKYAGKAYNKTLAVASFCFIPVGNIEQITFITKETHNTKKDYHCIRFCEISIEMLKIQPKQALESPI